LGVWILLRVWDQGEGVSVYATLLQKVLRFITHLLYGLALRPSSNKIYLSHYWRRIRY
jgi:hypothetical protein